MSIRRTLAAKKKKVIYAVMDGSCRPNIWQFERTIGTKDKVVCKLARKYTLIKRKKGIGWQGWFNVGVQYFCIVERTEKKEAEWFCWQFCKALGVLITEWESSNGHGIKAPPLDTGRPNKSHSVRNRRRTSSNPL